MKVSLLDEQKNPIQGYSYDTSLQRAPYDSWKKEEHVFPNIPPGVRYVEFRDGGHDEKNWAGHFGVKMLGAFVGVMPNGEEFIRINLSFDLIDPEIALASLSHCVCFASLISAF